MLETAGHQVVLIKNGTSDPEMMMSELTCNFVSASTTTSRKRKQINSRGVDNDQMPHHQQQQQQQQQQQHYLINPQQQQQVPHQENVSTSHNYNYNYYFPAASSCRSTKLPPNKLDHQLMSTHDHVCVMKYSVEEENRLNQSGGAEASTSGQTRRRRRRSSRYHDDDDDAVLLSVVSSPQLVPPPLRQHSQLHHLTSSNSNCHQNLDDEIDALIQLQHQTLLRSVVEQTQQKQCRLLMSALEQQVQTRLEEKQIELENAWGKQAELEEKVKQMSSENQMWFNVAKNNEAMVLSLSSTLEHQLILLHLHHQKNQNTTMKKAMGLVVVEEGFGDSSTDHGGGGAHSSNINCHQQLQVNVEEREYKAVSSSNVDVRDHGDDDASMMMMTSREHQQQQQQQHRKMCKVCKMTEVSVLLLPCRHLCLCKDCEAKLQACPICNSFKNASLQVFMS